MKRRKNIKCGQILNCYDREGAMTYQLLITDISKKTVRGRINYSSSAYGSAVVHDNLERGKLTILKWKNLASCQVKNDPDAAAKIIKAAATRKKMAQGFIGDRNPMQSINMIYDDKKGTIDVQMVSTLPNKDREGVPEVCLCWCCINDMMTADEIDMALSRRFDRVSSGGTFLPQTKVTFRSELSYQSFKLEDGNQIVFPQEMSKELNTAVNLFLDAARSQYGIESDWVPRQLGPKTAQYN